MDGQKLLKFGLCLWLGYEILKEINSNSRPITNNVNSANYVPASIAEPNAIYHENNKRKT